MKIHKWLKGIIMAYLLEKLRCKMTNQREAFEKWWGEPRQSYHLDMTQEQKIDMWVWEAWQAALDSVVLDNRTTQKPLSDDEVGDIWEIVGVKNAMEFARAIEKAHGIE